MKHFSVGIIVAILSVSQMAFAEKKTVKNWLENSNSWHFYNEEEPEKKKEIEKIAIAYAEYMQESEHKPMSGEWIKENLPKIRSKAGDDPTAENVLAMLYIEKVLRDRGKRLGVAAMKFAQLDPYLDASHKPASTNQSALKARVKFKQRKREVANQLLSSQKIGLWIFYNSKKCDLCEPAFQVYRKFIDENNTPSIVVATDGVAPKSEHLKGLKVNFDVDAADKHGITEFPTIYAFNLDSKEFFPISRGYITQPSFIDRLLSLASYAGWIDQPTQNYASSLYDPFSFSEVVFSDEVKNPSNADIVNQIKSQMESEMIKDNN